MPLSAAASAREILTGLHEVMAGRGAAQSKLDKVVDLIAEAMESEVCSIYLLRDNKLELFATHGLRKEAVHVTRLGMGEGLVGTIAAEGAHPEPCRSRGSPRLRISAGNRRGALPQLRRRADRPTGKPDRRPRRSACRPAPLRGCGDRGASDRRDGAVGNDRRRAAGRRRPPQPPAQRRPAPARRPQAGRGHGDAAKRCSTSRA